jgi:hypothetical protein
MLDDFLGNIQHPWILSLFCRNVQKLSHAYLALLSFFLHQVASIILESTTLHILFELFFYWTDALFHRTILLIFLYWRWFFRFNRRLFWNWLHFYLLVQKLSIIRWRLVVGLSLVTCFVSVCGHLRSFGSNFLKGFLVVIVILHLRDLIKMERNVTTMVEIWNVFEFHMLLCSLFNGFFRLLN